MSKGADTVHITSTKRNVGLLAACQAMLFTNNSTLIAINGLAGLSLAPYKALATLPVSCWVLGGAIATMAASLHMKRVGRQAGLMSGTWWAIVGALICASAIWLQSFWLLCLGTLVWGVYNAYGQYYRFAAAPPSTQQVIASVASAGCGASANPVRALIANRVELFAKSIAWQAASSATLRLVLFIYTVVGLELPPGRL